MNRIFQTEKSIQVLGSSDRWPQNLFHQCFDALGTLQSFTLAGASVILLFNTSAKRMIERLVAESIQILSFLRVFPFFQAVQFAIALRCMKVQKVSVTYNIGN